MAAAKKHQLVRVIVDTVKDPIKLINHLMVYFYLKWLYF